MKISAISRRTIFAVSTIFLFAALIVSWHFTPPAESAVRRAPDATKLEDYDIRTDLSERARRALERLKAQAGKSELQISEARKRTIDAAEKLRAGDGNLRIEFNEDLRVAEVVSPLYDGERRFLTAPSARERTAILENYLKRNAALFGVSEAQIAALEVTADYTNPNGVLSFVHFEQKIGGVPVFRGEVKAGFTKRGEIIRVINNLAPGLDDAPISKDFGAPQAAVFAAAEHIGMQADGGDVKPVSSEPGELKITFERGRFSDETTAEKMYFPVDFGVARPAWRVLLWTARDAFYVIVDAATGELLWRRNITQYQSRTATFGVYGNTTSLLKTADSPTPFTPGCLSPLVCSPPPMIARRSFTLVGNEPPYAFNNLGWIPDNGLTGTPNQSDNVTDGNNVEAGIDRDGINGVDAPVMGNPNRVFNFNYNPPPGNPPPPDDPLSPEFQKGAVTNAFYVVNRVHDELYRLGFTEQARNFQHFNFGRGGSEGDRVSAEIQDSSGTNNANFATPADGARPRMQMYLFTDGVSLNLDGSLDAHVLVHEVTHGLSSRLHGNATGLGGVMASGMGEGWSDFYPLSLLAEPSDDVFGLTPVGGYVVGNHYYGARRFPYALKAVVGFNGFPHNPLTLGNLNVGNCSSFNSAFPPRFTLTSCGAALFIGEVWASALWEIRGQMVLRHGTVEGNRRALQIVTDAMKLSPLNPTLLQARDAVLAAAQANTAAPERNTDVIDAWRGFAIRGFGAGARINSTNPIEVVEAFDVPAALNNAPRRADFDGDNRSDLAVFRPANGVWYLNQSTGGFTAAQFGLAGDQVTPGDFDGDRKTDLAVFRGGTWYLMRSTAGFAQLQFGLAGDVPVVGDYDGDGRAEIAVFRSGVWYSYNLASGQTAIVAFGLAGDVPVTGDYDGDGRADQAIYRGDGQWHLNRSSLGYTVVQFGLAADQPVPADYDGDARTDPAVYRNGTWYLLQSTSGFGALQWGIATDKPAPADYDGDGKDDPAVYRDGVWWILRSTAGSQVTQFGLSGDMPVANRYLP